MLEATKNRALEEADFVIRHKCTLGVCARHFEVSSIVAQRDLTERLKTLDTDKYLKVQEILSSKPKREKGLSVIQLDYYDFSFIEEYESISSLALDYGLSPRSLLNTIRRNENGMYMNKAKELLIMRKDTYDKLKLALHSKRKTKTVEMTRTQAKKRLERQNRYMKNKRARITQEYKLLKSKEILTEDETLRLQEIEAKREKERIRQRNYVREKRKAEGVIANE